MRVSAFAILTLLSLPLAAANVNVNVLDYYFNANDVTVSTGDQVTWTFIGSAPHNVISDSATEVFSSGASQVSGTYSHTYTLTGNHPYHCGVHGAGMSGVIRVLVPTATLTPTPVPCINSSDSADLFVSFAGFPAQVITDQVLTVVLNMDAGSGGGSYNTAVGIQASLGSGVSAGLLSTPVPITTLGVGVTNRYTWTYSVSGSGTLSFSASGTGDDVASCPCVPRSSTACSGPLDVLPPSPTPSPTFTITPTPAFGVAPGSEPLLGPVPVTRGKPLCLYLPAGSAAGSGSVDLFNLAGERVSSASLQAGSTCVQTSAWAPGIYWARITVAGQARWQKLALIP